MSKLSELRPGGWEARSGHLHMNGDGTAEVTYNIRPPKERRKRGPGTWLIWGSVVLLAALAGVAFYVSYAAQYGFVFAIKHLIDAAAAEALIPDAGMLICALLALAMAVQGRSAKVARVVVVAFAGLSALMNYEAANSYSAHSITVYVMPAVAFAICTDLVVSVIRRFYYGVEEGSPWAWLGRFLARCARLAGLVILYTLRYALDRKETWHGLRQLVLNATPLPAPAAPQVNGTSKNAQLLALYQQHPGHGDRSKVSAVANELAPQVGLDPRTARTNLYRYLDKQVGARP